MIYNALQICKKIHREKNPWNIVTRPFGILSSCTFSDIHDYVWSGVKRSGSHLSNGGTHARMQSFLDRM